MKRGILGITIVLVLAGASSAVAGYEEGVAAFQAGKFQDAVREFEAAVAQRPEWPGGHLMLGRALLKVDKPQQAVAALRKAYDLDPNSPQTKMVLGQAYLEAKRYTDASGILKTIDASKLDANQRAVLHQLNAAAMSGSGQSDGALDAIRRAAAANPSDGSLQYQLGALALSAQDVGTAVTALEKATRLKAGDPEILKAYTKALLLQGRTAQGPEKVASYRRAVDVAQQLVTKANTYENVLTLGEAQLGAKAYREAVATFEKAKALKPGDWLVAFYIAQAQTSLEQFGPAEQTLTAALSGASGDAQRRLNQQLAFVYRKLKKYDQAIATYKKAGDERSAREVAEQAAREEENKLIDAQNEALKELEREQERLQQQMKQVPPG